MHVTKLSHSIEPVILTSIIRDGDKENIPTVKSLETTN